MAPGAVLRARICRSTFSLFKLHGTRRVSLRLWTSTKRPCRAGRGQPGCREITIKRGNEPAQVSLPVGRVLLATHLDRAGAEVDQGVSLRADDGIVVKVRSES